VGAIVTAAHSLGVKVMAEGVESEVEAQQVRALACDAAQGNRYHAPAPVEEIVAWTREVFTSSA
jgi:EAL domain-containing protein (putative c-di-GMP-specific phosphodiesterase class I)